MTEGKKRYTLDDMMRVTHDEDVVTRGRKVHYWFRTLSAVEADARQDVASAAARSMYRRLKDQNSVEYMRYMQELYELPRAEIEELVLALNTSLVLKRAAEREIHQNDYPEPPDNPLLSEVIEAEEANEEIEQEVQTARAKWVEDEAEKYRQELAALPVEALMEEAKRLKTDQIANAAYSDAYVNCSLYYGVFKDKARRQRKFASPEEVGMCDPGLRSVLRSTYFDMDTFALEPDELKN